MSVVSCSKKKWKEFFYICILKKTFNSSCSPFSSLEAMPFVYIKPREGTWRLASLQAFRFSPPAKSRHFLLSKTFPTPASQPKILSMFSSHEVLQHPFLRSHQTQSCPAPVHLEVKWTCQLSHLCSTTSIHCLPAYEIETLSSLSRTFQFLSIYPSIHKD